MLIIFWLLNKSIFSWFCSVHEARIPFSQQIFGKKPIPSKEEQDELTCCAQCTCNYEKEAMLKFGQHKTITCDTKHSDKPSTPLPDWLKPHDMDPTNKVHIILLSFT